MDWDDEAERLNMKRRSKECDILPNQTVLIACNIAEVRRRLRKDLEKNFLIYEVAQPDALEKYVMNLKPSVLLLDASLQEVDAVEAVSAVQRLSPSTCVVFLTGSPNQKEAIDFLKAGAKGYSHRDINPALLVKIVQVVQKGEIWIGRSIIPCLLEELGSLADRWRNESHSGTEVRHDLDLLTPRERSISQLIGEGFNNKEISRRLKISEKTVKCHLTAIFRKLEIPDRLRLALMIAANRESGIEPGQDDRFATGRRGINEIHPTMQVARHVSVASS
jgi:DNA-binding NarL/FixJ family response regulator